MKSKNGFANYAALVATAALAACAPQSNDPNGGVANDSDYTSGNSAGSTGYFVWGSIGDYSKCNGSTTDSVVATLTTQGFVKGESLTQTVDIDQYAGNHYYKDEVAFRMTHPDGRVKYATCIGAVGPDFPMGRRSTLVTNSFANDRQFSPTFTFRGRPKAEATIKDFKMGGFLGWESTLTVDLNGKVSVFKPNGANEYTNGDVFLRFAEDGTLLRYWSGSPFGAAQIAPPPPLPSAPVATCGAKQFVASGNALTVDGKTFPIVASWTTNPAQQLFLAQYNVLVLTSYRAGWPEQGTLVEYSLTRATNGWSWMDTSYLSAQSPCNGGADVVDEAALKRLVANASHN
jgi:hypothetical protein